MATSGFRSEDEENNLESLLKWPLEYVNESKEYICGWCGQVLLSTHTAEDLETHFNSCKNNNENGLLMIFKELRKINHKLERLDDDLQEKVDKMKAEVMEEIKNEMVNVKSEVKKNLETEIKSGETRDAALSTLFWKVKTLEEGVKEKMAEMNGRVIGVTETISAAVRSVLEAKETLPTDASRLNELGRLKQDTEALWTELRKSERDNQSTKTRMEEDNARLKTGMQEDITQFKTEMKEDITQLKTGRQEDITQLKTGRQEDITQFKTGMQEDITQFKTEMKEDITQLKTGRQEDITQLKTGRQEDITQFKTGMLEDITQFKTGMETFSEQLKTNDRELQTLKLQMQNERTKMEAAKKLAEESIPFQQIAITMNSYNLSTHNYLFQPSFRWTIDGIQALTAQKTFQLNSELFQWNGYPVRARAKLQLKENDSVYISLCLDDMVKYERELKDLKLIPQIYYILKNTNRRNSNDKGAKAGNLFKTSLKKILDFKRCLGHKSWFDLSSYCENDLVVIEIYVEPFPMTQLVHSYNGALVWVIEHYEKRLQSEKDKIVLNQESGYFYNGPRGYRVQVKMNLHGAEGGGPTAGILFRTGLYDADLPHSFPHSTTVTLVNHKTHEKSISKTIEKDIQDKKFYDFEICKFEEVEDLIENDALYCKVTIQSQ